MEVVKYLVYLSIFLPVPVYLSNIHDEGFCPATPLNSNVCRIEESPTFPLIESRIADQVPLYIPANPPQHPIDFETRGYMYLFDEEQKKPAEILKGITLDHLDIKGAKTISDLLKLESQEISKPQKTNKLSKVWQIDEIQNLRGPQYLPDVVLETDIIQNDEGQHLKNQFLDENEKKLGRFVVEDVPPQNQHLNAMKNSLPINNVKSEPKAPSIIVSSIVGINEYVPETQPPRNHINLEPFVEFAMDTNMEDMGIPMNISKDDLKEAENNPYTIIGDTNVEEAFPIIIESQTESNVTTEMPATNIVRKTMSNVVEKNSVDSKNVTVKKRQHRRTKKRRINNHREKTSVGENVAKNTDNTRKETKLEETTTGKDHVIETKPRIIIENDSNLDKLLTVM